jgi:hypothetical protein
VPWGLVGGKSSLHSKEDEAVGRGEVERESEVQGEDVKGDRGRQKSTLERRARRSQRRVEWRWRCAQSSCLRTRKEDARAIAEGRGGGEEGLEVEELRKVRTAEVDRNLGLKRNQSSSSSTSELLLGEYTVYSVNFKLINFPLVNVHSCIC